MSADPTPSKSPLPESPFLTVGVDDKENTCWLVVSRDITLVCHSGSRAVELLRLLCTSKGLPLPR